MKNKKNLIRLLFITGLFFLIQTFGFSTSCGAQDWCCQCYNPKTPLTTPDYDAIIVGFFPKLQCRCYCLGSWFTTGLYNGWTLIGYSPPFAPAATPKGLRCYPILPVPVIEHYSFNATPENSNVSVYEEGPPECCNDSQCDDSNPCTIDACDPEEGYCTHTPKCDDGDPCTTDTCDPNTGECTHTPKCDDGDPCTTDTCDPNTGECTHINICSTTTTPPPTTIPPDLIELSSFVVVAGNNKVVLRWETESETNNSGFNLYRSETENGNYLKINASLITAQGSSTQGASYEFIDNNVQNKKTYYYKLEDIDLSGTSTMHGPVSATPRLIHGILGK
ncbi:MAG: hypothetical protein NTZ51_06485 [Proteobacteria bacterium]|nr:hypothetical protein [Pseudomonadota bacterium]